MTDRTEQMAKMDLTSKIEKIPEVNVRVRYDEQVDALYIKLKETSAKRIWLIWNLKHLKGILWFSCG